MIRILVADSYLIFRNSLKKIIGEFPDMLVVDEACNGLEALSKMKKKDFDLVILDLSMPGMSGLEVLKQIKKDKPVLPILVLSQYPEKNYARRAFKAGASGYVTKQQASNELINAIRTVCSGERYISKSLAAHLGEDKHSQKKLGD